jgi:hypothetical protein
MPSSGIGLRHRALVQSGPVRKSGRTSQTEDQWVYLECLLLLSRGSRVLCPARFSNYCECLLDATPPSTGAGTTGRNRHLLLKKMQLALYREEVAF